jgi:hypothetical protein
LDTSQVETPEQKAQRVAGLTQAITQLEMLVSLFGASAPERVKKAAQEFLEALTEWKDA